MKVLILAAGKGTRMQSDLPKVLTPLAGKPLIDHALDSVIASSIDKSPVVVVGHQADLVQGHLAKRKILFVLQEEQLGTGHAVKVCQEAINYTEPVMVLYGDHALIKPETLARLAKAYETSMAKIAMVTYRVPHFQVMNGQFERYGRILRDIDENMYAIREAKDATEDELLVKEVNPGYYLFDGPWLWENLNRLSASNAQNEYYLTDLVEIAINQGELVETVLGDDLVEAVGINTVEQLQSAEKLIQRRIK